MLNIVFYLRGEKTISFTEILQNLKINPLTIQQEVIEKIQNICFNNKHLKRNDLIRKVYTSLMDIRYIQSHIGAAFGISCSSIGRILKQKSEHESVGRPRSLTPEQERQIVQRVQDCQKLGRCQTVDEITSWINSQLLSPHGKEISHRYLEKNQFIQNNLDLGRPINIEEVRINACKYNVFESFFNEYLSKLFEHKYDPRLIINFDETTTNAEKSKVTSRVLYSSDLNIAPTVPIESKSEHITLAAAISASGEALTPYFIIKNKTVTSEQALFGKHFWFGPYALAYDASGWENSVSNFLDC